MANVPAEPKPHFVPTFQNAIRNQAVRWVLLASVVVVIVYLAIRWHPRDPSSHPLNPFASKGREAPNFALLTPDGKTIHLSDYRGKAVLINFFGTTCVPCRQESPHLVEMQKRNAARGFQIIGIEMYGSSEDAFKKYRDDFGTNYVLVQGTNIVGDQYGVNDLPVSYFLNGRGAIIAATVGLRPEKEMDGYVEATLRSQ